VPRRALARGMAAARLSLRESARNLDGQLGFQLFEPFVNLPQIGVVRVPPVEGQKERRGRHIGLPHHTRLEIGHAR
jgi:hypothetical protein